MAIISVLELLRLLGYLVLSVFIAIFLLFLPYAFLSYRPRRFPSGPPTVPLLGNLHQIPLESSFLQFHKWRSQYGAILGLKFGPTNVVILNDRVDVEALFEKRGNIYSARPDNYIAQEIMCPNGLHLLLSSGAMWHTSRKAARGALTPKAARWIATIQNAEAAQTVCDLIGDPANYREHIRRYSTAAMLTSLYGRREAHVHSKTIHEFCDVQERFSRMITPGNTPPVDAFPFLKWMPEILAPWKREAREIRQDQLKLYLRLVGETRSHMQAGTPTGCFLEQLLGNQERSRLSDERIAYIAGNLLEAGSDTSSSTLLSLTLGFLSNPDALKRAQEEVDRHCGSDRSPNSDDMPELKYCMACANEVLRWRPVAAGGAPHMLTQNDRYKDYEFPAGTMFFANAFAINHDLTEYDEPELFNPDRWIDCPYGTKGANAVGLGERRKKTYTFGAGRRICTGQTVAENSMRIFAAKLVWAFDIGVPDETSANTVDVSVETAYEGGFLICPKPFAAKFTPRSKHRAQVVQRELQDLDSFFSQFLGH
ncbi:putative cytochrome P450 [Thozetella sp. PMI_491]|nr:putative cytochrome P450 [Thozetella sp. PMI_491]